MIYMREIKFRAWVKDIEPHDMYMVDDIIFKENSIGYLESTHQSFDFILMQYTGLRDNNGVEIYEGDLVRPANEKDKTYCIEVKLGAPYDQMRPHWMIWPEDNEVIGNIYENPDLIDNNANV